MSISSVRSRLASFSGVDGSILMMTMRKLVNGHSELIGITRLAKQAFLAIPCLHITQDCRLTVLQPPNGITHTDTERSTAFEELDLRTKMMVDKVASQTGS
jgi:hypothetical protein